MDVVLLWSNTGDNDTEPLDKPPNFTIVIQFFQMNESAWSDNDGLLRMEKLFLAWKWKMQRRRKMGGPKRNRRHLAIEMVIVKIEVNA